MSEPVPLPDLHQSEVDQTTLKQLFTDIGTLTEIQEIIPKYAPGYVAENSPQLQLDQAFQQLITHQLRGLQLRYRHQGKIWWDTLIPLPGGLYRIVRIEHDFQ